MFPFMMMFLEIRTRLSCLFLRLRLHRRHPWGQMAVVHHLLHPLQGEQLGWTVTHLCQEDLALVVVIRNQSQWRMMLQHLLHLLHHLQVELPTPRVHQHTGGTDLAVGAKSLALFRGKPMVRP